MCAHCAACWCLLLALVPPAPLLLPPPLPEQPRLRTKGGTHPSIHPCIIPQSIHRHSQALASKGLHVFALYGESGDAAERHDLGWGSHEWRQMVNLKARRRKARRCLQTQQ